MATAGRMPTTTVSASSNLAICAIVPLWGRAVLGEWGKNPYSYYQQLYLPLENPGLGIDSTPPLRALPPDMAKYNDYARAMHEVHTAERLSEVVADQIVSRLGLFAARTAPPQ